MRILATFLMISIVNLTQAQKTATLGLNNQLSILNGRAYLSFPKEAKNIARQSDIMSADPNASKETRIIYDNDKQRLVFFARELFVTSSSNLLASVTKGKNDEYKSRILVNKDSISGVLLTPLKFDSSQNAILINNFYVKTQDNSVFVIGAYINPEGFKDLKEYQQLSERVFATLTKGNRILSFKRRTEELPIFDGKKKFSIALPEAYTVTTDKKYDFEVLNFQKMKNIDDTNWVSVTIYTGFHPSYFYGDYGLDENEAKKPSGKFLGEKVEWLSFNVSEKKFYLKEQKIPCDQIQEGMIVHVAMLSNNQQGIDELTKIIEGIRITGN